MRIGFVCPVNKVVLKIISQVNVKLTRLLMWHSAGKLPVWPMTLINHAWAERSRDIRKRVPLSGKSD